MGACANGATPKPGEPTYYQVTDADLDRWYGTGNPIRVLAGFFLNGRTYNVGDLCTSNPDQAPPLSWTDVLTGGLTAGRWGPISVISENLDAYVRYLLFWEHCDCIGGVGGPSNPCVTRGPFTLDTGNTSVGPGPFSATDRYWIPASFGSDLNYPAGQHHVRLRWVGVPSGTVKYRLYTGGTGVIVAQTVVGGLSGSIDGEDPAKPSSVSLVFTTTGTSIPHTAYLDFWNASGESGCAGLDYAAPTPDDIDTTGMPTFTAPSGTTTDQLATQLQQLQATVAQLMSVVGYTQTRQGLLGGHEGAVRAGLTGHGTFTLPLDVIGLVVEATGLPSGYRETGTEPPQVFDLGWLTFKGQGGWEESQRIDHPYRLFVLGHGLADNWSYDLAAGVTATITEIIGGS